MVEKIEPPPVDEDSDDNQVDNIDEEEYVKNLIKENSDDYDGLEELRRMIRRTKREIEDYAGDLYCLKTSVSDANIGFKEIGRGVNDDVMWDIEVRMH